MEAILNKAEKKNKETKAVAVFRVGKNFLVGEGDEKKCHLVYRNESTIMCTCQQAQEGEWFECEHISQLRLAHKEGRIRVFDGNSPLEALLSKPLRRWGEIEYGADGTPYIPWEVVVERLSSWLTYNGWGLELSSSEVYSDPWMAGKIDAEDLNDLTKDDVIEVNGPNRIVVVDNYTYNVCDAEEYKEEVESKRKKFIEEAEARQSGAAVSSLGIGIELLIEEPGNGHGSPTKSVIVSPQTFLSAVYAQ